MKIKSRNTGYVTTVILLLKKFHRKYKNDESQKNKIKNIYLHAQIDNRKCNFNKFIKILTKQLMLSFYYLHKKYYI